MITWSYISGKVIALSLLVDCFNAIWSSKAIIGFKVGHRYSILRLEFIYTEPTFSILHLAATLQMNQIGHFPAKVCYR